jgi:hypothetical protein
MATARVTPSPLPDAQLLDQRGDAWFGVEWDRSSKTPSQYPLGPPNSPHHEGASHGPGLRLIYQLRYGGYGEDAPHERGARREKPSD